MVALSATPSTMHLTSRPARPADFENWLRMERACFGFDDDTPAGARREWDMLFSPRARGSVLTLVVADTGREYRDSMLGFGAAALVTDSFVHWLLGHDTPYLNGYLADPPAGCPAPLLSETELRAANGGAGLCAIVTHWAWAEDILDARAALRVRTFLRDRFLEVHGGFNLNRVLIEVIGAEARSRAEAAGCTVVNSYDAYYARRSETPEEMHACLLGATREDALRQDGAAIAAVFVYTRPRFHFDPAEQEFLCAARSGLSDEELCQTLFISPGTVKKRWAGIYDRVDIIDPTLLPQAAGSVRGAEKRRRLLRYVREHLEELRPAEPG